MKLLDLLSLIDTTAEKVGTRVFLVGGVVRDKLLNRTDKLNDLDLTTGDDKVNFVAKELSIALKKTFDLKSKTMDDGHTSIFFGNMKIDFSSNFNLPNIDQLLKEKGINNPNALQKEMFSRDFTCNALLMSLDLQEVIDPTGMGFKDIQNKTIRTCLAPEITLTQNKNRVIRSIYLSAKLDFQPEKELINWVKEHPESVKISTEHGLIEKLDKALDYNAEKTVALIGEMGLWKELPITDKLYPFYAREIEKGAL